MNLLEVLSTHDRGAPAGSRIFGVVVGIVTNTQDPDSAGRVKVKFPWLTDQDESNWARIVSPLAGNDRGIAWLPQVDDEVLVAFEHGDVRAPYVLGAVWNGVDRFPELKRNDSGNDLLVIRSRTGQTIVLDDASGAGRIELVDGTEKNRIAITSSDKTVTIEVDGDIQLKAPNGKIVLSAKTVEIASSAETKVDAKSTLDLKASGTTTVKGSTVNIN